MEVEGSTDLRHIVVDGGVPFHFGAYNGTLIDTALHEIFLVLLHELCLFSVWQEIWLR